MLRQALDRDIPGILRLEGMLFSNSMSEAQIAIELRVGRGFVLEAAVDNPVLGYILVRDDGAVLDITRLAVDPAQQRAGVGTELLRHVLAMNRPTVLAVKKGNHRAIRLYTRHGFVVTGHFIEERAWAMRRDVAPSDRPST
jgi:ribosomal protein S18 acetylase RimI-like enzyme